MQSNIKKPLIPRCLCNNYLEWLLQIASPSLVHSYRFGCKESKQATEFFKKSDEYIKNITIRKE
jgi:hypothetical protein